MTRRSLGVKKVGPPVAEPVPDRPVVLCVGGFDPLGAAGIVADVRHLAALGVHAAAVPTALTVQHLHAVDRVEPLDPALFREMLDGVRATMAPRVVLVGMLAHEHMVRELLLWLHEYNEKVVLDPVCVSTSGAPLIDDAGFRLMADVLVPRADIVLPNVHELARLTGEAVPTTEAGRAALAGELLQRGAGAVLAKGGHAGGTDSVDILVSDAGSRRLLAPRLDGFFRGAGGALAAAIAAALALGATVEDAVGRAHGQMALVLKRAAAAQSPWLQFSASGSEAT